MTFVRVFMLSIIANAQLERMSTNPLEASFLSAPTAVKPYVWRYWMGSNISNEGITKDFEAMNEEGNGGVTIFNLPSAVQESYAPTLNNPWPEQTYRGPAYGKAVKCAATEA